MGNRVYYGEYTLRHWLDLILKKNIVLPEYQRYFVWDENRVKTLIETFNRNQFTTVNKFIVGVLEYLSRQNEICEIG